MGKLFKNIGLLLLSAAIVFIALGILVQKYMQSPEYIEKISQSFSDSMGGTFSIGAADINLLRGFSLSEVLIESDEDPAQPFLAAEHSNLTYNPLALLLKELELTSIELVKPTLTFTQNENGNWWLPRPQEDTHPVLDTGLLSFQLILKDISLTDGIVRATRSDGTTVLDANQINVEGKLKASEIGTEASGQVAVAKTRLGQYFTIHNIQSPIRYKDEVLEIPSLSGTAYSGTATGSIEIDLRIGGPEFAIELNLEKLDLAQLIQDFQGKSQWLDGKLSTVCRLEGRFEALELLQGTGTLNITEGTLSGFAFLQELSQLFPDQKFPETQFERITGNYKIAEKKLTIYNLEAVSENVQLTGAGTISVSREMNIDMRLSLSPTFTELLDEETASQFTQRDDGFSTITFSVKGTLDEPESNLLEKLKKNQERIQSEAEDTPSSPEPSAQSTS